MALLPSGDLGKIGQQVAYAEGSAVGWFKFKVPRGTKTITVKAYGDGTVTALGVNLSFGYPDRQTNADTAVNPVPALGGYGDGQSIVTQAVNSGRRNVEGIDCDEAAFYLDIFSLTLGTATKIRFWISTSGDASKDRSR